MPWGLWSASTHQATHVVGTSEEGGATASPPSKTGPTDTATIDRRKLKSRSWNESLNATNWDQYREPRTIVPPLLAAGTAVGVYIFYRSYLRRLPGAAHITPGLFHRRGLLGKVTSVGDGDNFHMFHTPGGRLAGWGWLRKVPSNRKSLKGRTVSLLACCIERTLGYCCAASQEFLDLIESFRQISVRIAGIDAPECAHFGRPAQPYAAEALAFLRSYLCDRRVRAYIYRRDQYERVVASVFVRRPPFFFPRKDVGLEMLRQGLATTYEAKTGAEFGGPRAEAVYRAAEARARRKRRGLWSLQGVESPRSYKDRMKGLQKDSSV
jgi:endonuclease YncB( thermonuclease family)